MWFSKVFNQFSLNLARMHILVKITILNEEIRNFLSFVFMATAAIFDFERYVLRARFLKNG